MLCLTDMRAARMLALETLTQPVNWSIITPDPGMATFHQPHGAVMDHQSLYVADAAASHVVVLTSVTTSIIDTAAEVIGPMSAPRGLAISDDQIIVADTGNHRILSGPVGAAGPWTAYGNLAAVGGDTKGTFLAPVSVFVDAEGRILICDAGLQRLVRIDDATGAGWAEITLPPGARPYGASAGPGTDAMVTDQAHGRVYGVALDDTVSVLIDGGPGRDLIAPVAAVVDGDAIVVADAAAAQLTAWAPNPVSGNYEITALLRGDPGPTSGPAFSAISGLTAGEPL